MRLSNSSVLVSAIVALTCTFTMVGAASADTGTTPSDAVSTTEADPTQPAPTEPAPTEPTPTEPTPTEPTPTPTPTCPPAPHPAGSCANPRLGEPPANAPIAAGSYFSYPHRTFAESVAIRNRVLNTINSTWGWYNTDAVGTLEPTWKRGTIRMTTWSFNDSTVEDALKAARQRGVLVQVIAARSVNTEKNYKSWFDLKAAFNAPPESSSDQSFARDCAGACRGSGGAAHSKYFLFDDVGPGHARNIVVQTSMNLTRMAYQGQWNQATVMWDADVYGDFYYVFRQSAVGATGSGDYEGGYLRYSAPGNVFSMFYPGGSSSNDPILAALNKVSCRASSGGINGRTRIRVIQYAIFETRGTAVAKKLRSLWNNGCNVRIIYSVSSRPVLSILRSRSGRGAIPMKQSVVKNRAGDIVKYNHSKWLAISGSYGGKSGTYTVVPGSANWADLSYRSDEQMQQIISPTWTRPYFSTFDKTWAERTSSYPAYGRVGVTARVLSAIPEQPTFGEGIYKYMSEGG